MTNSKSIYYLDNYYPKRYNKNDESSKRILELKNGREQAIEFWYSQLKLFLDIDCAIAIVPSHKQSNDNRSSGISSLAKKLIKDSPKRTDLVSSLNRHTTIEKLSGGGNREIETHLHSIEVINKDLIKSQSILLLDDVTTSGNSLIACKQLLEKAGADEVICLALTKTVGGSIRSFTQEFVKITSKLSSIFSLYEIDNKITYIEQDKKIKRLIITIFRKEKNL